MILFWTRPETISSLDYTNSIQTDEVLSIRNSCLFIKLKYYLVKNGQMGGRGQQHLSKPIGSFRNHFGSFVFDRLVPPPSMSNEPKIKLW